MTFLPALPKLSERAFAAQVDAVARMFGWAMWRDNATNAPRACPRCHASINLPRNAPGWPDRVYLRGDTLWFVEFKASRGRLSEAQKSLLVALRAVSRVKVTIWRPEDMETIVEALR